ncbi:hypothetical protein [Thermoflexus sp.]|uniref:hypothetical protein n=1 Tax=Thermoflexus sp. TaxID=1969742 RepID=UPI0035E443F5
MLFTVTDFQDLLRLLREHPDWRAQLWATLAGEELLRLPGEFTAHRQELRAFWAETDRRLAELTRAVERLAEAQRRHYEEFATFRMETERRFAELREELAALRAETEWRFATLAEV